MGFYFIIIYLNYIFLSNKSLINADVGWTTHLYFLKTVNELNKDWLMHCLFMLYMQITSGHQIRYYNWFDSLIDLILTITVQYICHIRFFFKILNKLYQTGQLLNHIPKAYTLTHWNHNLKTHLIYQTYTHIEI